MSNSDTDSQGFDSEDDPVETVVAGVVSALIFAVGFGLLAVGFPWFWIVFPVGFAGVLPAAIGLTKLYQDREETTESTRTAESTQTSDQAALETLREQYARGEIDDEAFERRLDTLLETESVEDATRYVDRERTYE